MLFDSDMIWKGAAMKRTVACFLLILTVVAFSCGEEPQNVIEAADLKDAFDAASDLSKQEAVVPDVPVVEETADELEWDLSRATPDTLLECEAGEGCFLDKCSENSDCQSGWCVEHMGEAVCSKTCQEECPAGWTCRLVADTVPDVVYICVSDHANLCRPCSSGNDCKTTGAEDVCVSYGVEGNFCGGTCSVDDDCPWGFACTEAETVEGVVLTQCVAEAGVCPCTEKSAMLGLFTPCSVTNEFGSCPGNRVCTQEGLLDCDAALPAQEECNGLDDNCDGDIDEPLEVAGDYVNLCNDDNDCTTDLCNGADGCGYESLGEGECVDGDACTIGDHCDEGECVGLPIVCDDSNPCTDDSCDGLGGCQIEYNSAQCDDGDPCTVADSCSQGECLGYAVECECQEEDDCTALDDGNLCNGTLFCDKDKLPYQCAVDPETVVVCPVLAGQESICGKAVCNAETGKCSVEPANEGFACDDSDSCTVGDQCEEGQCTPGVPVICEDANECTDDSCDPESGCVFADNTEACNDGDVCTTADHCAQGQCVAGGQLACDDANECTDDSCDPGLGCVHAANSSV